MDFLGSLHPINSPRDLDGQRQASDTPWSPGNNARVAARSVAFHSLSHCQDPRVGEGDVESRHYSCEAPKPFPIHIIIGSQLFDPCLFIFVMTSGCNDV